MLPSIFLRVLFCFCFLAIATQPVSAQEKSKRAGYERYAKGIMEHFDTNGDGSLGPDEIKEMRRKPNESADTNSDGEFSLKELVNSYMPPEKTGRRKDWKPKSNQDEEEKKPAELKGDVKLLHDGGKITIVGDPDDVAAVEAFLKKTMNEVETDRVNENAVELSIWIVNSAGSMDAAKLKGKSREVVQKSMSELAKNDTVRVESFHLDTSFERSFELSKGKQVPVIQGMNQSRGGARVSQVSNHEVGTMLFGSTIRRGNNVVIDFRIEKSTVEDSNVPLMEIDDDIFLAKTIQQFKLESEIECVAGKASVVRSIENDHSWTLVFCASMPQSSAGAMAHSSERKPGERDAEAWRRRRRSRD